MKPDEDAFDRAERAIDSGLRVMLVLACVIVAAVLAAGFAALVHFGIL